MKHVCVINFDHGFTMEQIKDYAAKFLPPAEKEHYSEDWGNVKFCQRDRSYQLLRDRYWLHP